MSEHDEGSNAIEEELRRIGVVFTQAHAHQKLIDEGMREVVGMIPGVGGHKDDAYKPRLDLIPPEVLFALAEVLTSGAKKYGERNWEQGMNYNRVYRAAVGHLLKWWMGEDRDPEFLHSHLDHALCCVVFLSAYVKRPNMDRFDNRPHRLGE